MPNIDPSKLPPIITQINSVASQLNALYVGALSPSPPGTTITPASGGVLYDATTAAWTFGTVVGGGGTNILRNGANSSGSGVQMVIDVNGVLWTQNNAGSWYQYKNGWVISSVGPTL